MQFVILLAVLALLLFIYVATGVRIVRPYQRGIVEQLGQVQGDRRPRPAHHHPVRPDTCAWSTCASRSSTCRRRRSSPRTTSWSPSTRSSTTSPPTRSASSTTSPTSSWRSRSWPRPTCATSSATCSSTRRSPAATPSTSHLRQILDDATDKWGVRVVRVEIQRIDPPPDVMHVDARADEGRAEPTGRRHPGRGRPHRRDHPGRGRAAVRHPRRRGPEAAADPQRPGRGRGHPGHGRRRALPPRGRRRRARPTPSRRSTRPSTRATRRADLLAVKYLETLGQMANGQATKIIVPDRAERPGGWPGQHRRPDDEQRPQAGDG